VFQINFGLESADPVVLNRCRKLRNTGGESDDFAQEREFLKKIEWAVSTSNKIGLTPTLSIILGLPGETQSSALHTLDMVRRLGVKTYFHNHLLLHAGTELFLNTHRYGMRVRKSPYTLPYYTRLSYDPYTLPIIENSTTIDQVKVVDRERDIHYFQKLTGIPESDDRSAVLFYHIPKIKPSDLGWIKTFCSLDVELGWIAPAGVKPQDFAKLLVETELPSMHPHLLVPGPYGEGQYVWADYLSGTDYPDFFPVFHIIPISYADRQKELSGQNEKAVFIYTLTNPEDHSKFIELAEKMEKKGIESLPKPLLEGRFSLLDECRWSNIPCPAGNLTRIIIHPDRRISPCISGSCVGEVGENINEIKKRLEQYRKEEEKARGCATCSAQDTCSKCLFPAPIGRDEFCNLQRNNPGLQKTIKIISNLRVAYMYQTLPKDIFSTFYSALPPETLEGIMRLAKALALRKALKRTGQINPLI
jgi:radical SAM protein with 4Fe4S-binding SPASM domain